MFGGWRLNGTPQRLGVVDETRSYVANTYHPLYDIHLASLFPLHHPSLPNSPAPSPTPIYLPLLLPPAPTNPQPTCPGRNLYTSPAPRPQLLDSTDSRVPSSIPRRWTHRGGRKRGMSPQFTFNPHSSQEKKTLSSIPRAEKGNQAQ